MSSTGYGPRNAKLMRLLFDGDDTKYELWEARFLGYLQTLKLKETIVPSDNEPDEAKNEECYAELIQLLDDKSLSLVMRDAAGDGRKALKILRDHYASQGKPRIVALYTELTSLEKGENESVTDYIIRAEKSVTALKNAKEKLSDGLVIAMILKGLPDAYKPLVVHVTQSASEITFPMFKCQLKSFEETEKFHYKPKTDQVMKIESPSNSVNCFGCGRQRHFIKDCPDKAKNETTKWCSYHKSTTHSDTTCRRQRKNQEDTKAKQVAFGEESAEIEHSFIFKIHPALHSQCKPAGMLVDTGATSHVTKTDTLLATEKFLADCALYGQVKCLRSDNGTEFMNNDFQTLLRKRGIKHETSCPNSPHQNGTAERHWRTLFEMARFLLLERSVPKVLWPYAVQTAAHIRNRCYNNRTQTTPYFSMTGKKPDLSKMWVFGSECYTYEYNRKKLDPKCEKGVFVGYDKNSPVYLVYHPEAGKIMKHRLVKFIKSCSAEQGTQTEIASEDLGSSTKVESEISSSDLQKQDKRNSHSEGTGDSIVGEKDVESGESEAVGENNEVEDEPKTYSQRERKAPQYFGVENSTYVNTDYCYKVCGAPQTYIEAMNSPNAPGWEQAMKNELEALKVNDTFELTALPEGKNLVRGKWVYTVKEDVNGSETLKARYVAKEYSQVHGIDYEETFSPTADITSIRILMQLAAQYDLTVHQMDVRAAFLHAPIDHEIYMEQPEGFEEFSEDGDKLVYRLKKSLYGLKQSGKNWNKVLHEYLKNDGFVRNEVDHCVYRKQTDNGVIILAVWVDDLIIASNNIDMLCQFKDNMKCKFSMKDLGKISHFLGMDFKQEGGIIKMNQSRYIAKILDRFNMTHCKPRTTPCEQRLESTESSEAVEPRKYREIVGSLIYLMICTRPDISWVVSKLSQKLSCAKIEDLITAKHVLRYLKGTMGYELYFRKSDSELRLIAYSDADWASSLGDRHSTTGYCFNLVENEPLIAWKSKKQPTIALPTCEAEYVSLAATTQESMYLMQLLQGMDNKSYECTRIYEDNQGAIALSKNPVNK